MKPKNIPEFKALIERYETISLEEIKEAFLYFNNPSQYLTGYGDSFTCILCIAVVLNCHECIYLKDFGCLNGILKNSYIRINKANTPIKLFNAYRNRAKVLRKYAKTKNIEL